MEDKSLLGFRSWKSLLFSFPAFIFVIVLTLTFLINFKGACVGAAGVAFATGGYGNKHCSPLLSLHSFEQSENRELPTEDKIHSVFTSNIKMDVQIIATVMVFQYRFHQTTPQCWANPIILHNTTQHAPRKWEPSYCQLRCLGMCEVVRQNLKSEYAAATLGLLVLITDDFWAPAPRALCSPWIKLSMN